MRGTGPAPLGIDLGTTYSVVARADTDDVAEVLRHPSGAETMPSVVCFDAPGSVLVGEAAKAAAVALPDRTVALIKRQMGTDRLLYFDDRPHTPESISALILRGLVESVSPPGALTTDVTAVVTVPAYFGLREREATQQACELAGIRLLELTAEPVAASIHYGLRPDGACRADAPSNVLVYDLGGGTFDVTVLQVGAHSRTVATGGDVELGGADWDRRLVSHLLDEFRDFVPAAIDPEDDDAFMADLLLTAERVKKRLSTTERQSVPLRYQGHSVTITVSRAGFEELTADLLERTLDRIQSVLGDAAGKDVSVIDEVLLVGGSSRMPAVAAALEREFDRCPRLLDPDFAVAKGAALRARRLAAPVRPAAIGRRIDDAPGVVARSVGVLLQDSSEPSGERAFVQHIIHRNEELPLRREAIVATILDGQSVARIQVYEQAGDRESDVVDDNRRVLDGELVGIPPIPAGSPIEVVLAISLDGRLSVTATEPGSGVSLTLEAYIEGVLDGADQRRQETTLATIQVRR